ncbi:MAG TPA: hydrogenase small subunit [Burkholderiaceae bacterium]|nr:hydrogenase small subunit [Burkholderiaceae bacterium]
MTRSALDEHLRRNGVSRRRFLQFCAATAATLGLPLDAVPALAAAISAARRPSVIWLSFQECTGCTESLTRSHNPTLESLILEHVSLDYHHTLMAASGTAAEGARAAAEAESAGDYLLLADGSVPLKDGGIYSTIAGRTNLEMLQEAAKGAAAVIAIGSCAAYGGVPGAVPNPTGAVPIARIVKDKPVVNVPGCPPIPTVITGVLAHYLMFGAVPELDGLGRPLAYYSDTIHDRCYRRPFYDQGKFADSFDDEGARSGWCLFKLGCKGPTTHNACATTRWNDGASFPIQSGHGCLGCSEPGFWDAGSFYAPLSAPIHLDPAVTLSVAAAGAAAGAAMAIANRRRKAAARQVHQPAAVADLEKPL